jgi:hypothetical protein
VRILFAANTPAPLARFLRGMRWYERTRFEPRVLEECSSVGGRVLDALRSVYGQGVLLPLEFETLFPARRSLPARTREYHFTARGGNLPARYDHDESVRCEVREKPKSRESGGAVAEAVGRSSRRRLRPTAPYDRERSGKCAGA